MSVPTCDHLKEDGVFCSSPALTGRNYCYFHLNLRGRRLKAARARRRGGNPPLNLPFPEDMHAVQVSLAEIMWAIAEGRIEHKAAGLMLYALQQASTNLNRTPGWEGAREAVPNCRSLRALNFPDFEQRFGLPRDIDLEANPDATVPDDMPSPETQGAPPLSPGSGDRVGADAPEPVEGVGMSVSEVVKPADRVILSEKVAETDESKDPLVSAIPEGSAANPAPEVRTPPESVPFPEDELEQLHVTKLEEMEFFLYKVNFYPFTEEQEHELLLNWLRERRREELEDPELRAERGQLNDYIEARRSHSQAAQMDDPPLPSVGNCGDASAYEAA